MKQALFAVTVALVLLSGCGRDEKPVPKVPESAGAIELKETTVAELEKLIADQKGKVVLIDVWFLGCAPCVKKFPSFIELHRKYANEGLVCISLNVYPEELKEKDKVLEFLRKQGADIHNLIFKDEPGKVDAWQERNDAVLTPSYVVFNRKGERKSVPFPAKANEIEEFIKKQLAEK